MRWPKWTLGAWSPANEIAVDLGTANTLIYVKGEGIVLNEPSVVAIEKATGKIKGIGLEAKRMLGRTPDGILAVRPLKDGVIADFDVTEKMLRFFLKTIIDRHLFRVKPKVIVCVPSGITEVEKRAVRDSAQSAGAKEVYMVAEPMAAAIGVGLPVETPTGNMVIDIGGGTTEIAVIALSGIVSDTSIRTGGDELDQAIVQFMRKNYNLLIGEPTAEQIKIQIGSAAPVGEEREMEVKGRDLVSGIPKTVRVHSSEIREAIQEPVQAIVDAVRRALEITPPELASDVVDPLVNLQSNAERWHTAWQLSEERTARLDSAVMRGFNAVALQSENDQLRKLLGLGARLHTGFVPAEAVHNAVREDVVTTLTLTAGTRAGIKVYSPVVSPEGVVGLVQTADPAISIAILFSHPDFRASAMSGDGTAFGIVYPHLQQGLGGTGEYLLELHNVSFRTTLPAGTMIYTSGLGGTFPRGIPIGSVLRELKTAEGWTRTYLLQPSVNPSKVNSVMVLTTQRSPQRLDNVWQMVARVDSAAHSVASAGDSIARRAAADSARRVAADSAHRAAAGHPDSAGARRDTSARPVAVPAADSSARARPAADS